MKQTDISFCIEANKLKELDVIAAAMNRNRSDIPNEAISAYLDLYHWQTEHIQEGLRQADAGEFVFEEELNTVLRRRFR